MQATHSVIYFPKQSKPAPKPKKKKPEQKRCTVLEWIRNGYSFPGKQIPEPQPVATES